MSNVALATIASIRQSTHHVLSSLARDIDGAYFHHRALLENPEDAEMYAVEIVLSELKGTIDKQKIADNYASKKAIKPRINEIAEDEPHLTLNCGEDSKSTFCVNLADSIKAVTEGIEIAKAQIKGIIYLTTQDKNDSHLQKPSFIHKIQPRTLIQKNHPLIFFL